MKKKILMLFTALAQSVHLLAQGLTTSATLTAKTNYPSPTLNAAIRQKAGELGIDLKMSTVYCSDVFYTDDPWQEIAERTGADCVEMESFALFHNANVLKKQAACLLTISDSYVSKRELTAEERQYSFTEMMRLALETAVSSSVTKVAEVSAPGTGGETAKYMEKGRVVIRKDGKKYNAEGILIEE